MEAVSTDGLVTQLRMEFTDDVADLAGTWKPIGELDLRSGRCLATDPYADATVSGCVVDVEPGIYTVEVFEDEGDTLGVKLRWDRHEAGRSAST